MAPTVGNFNMLREAFKTEYSHHPTVLRYLERTWLSHKKQIMDAWVGKVLHLGCTTTSRVESSNSFLKRFLSSSVRDLLTLVQQLNRAIEHQVYELRKSHADDKFKRPQFCNQQQYADVVHKVSSFALSKAHAHFVPSANSICTKSFTATMGLPCAHAVQECKLKKQSLSLEHFNEHWHLS